MVTPSPAGTRRRAVDRLIDAVRAGESRALVLSGEAGWARRAAGLPRRARVGLPGGSRHGCPVGDGAGVRRVAAVGKPLLDHLDRLPGPQRGALETAFGLSAGSAPDRFLVGLAVPGLLSDAAEEEPLIGLVDDQQSLDHASAQALGFAARCLEAESVGLVSRRASRPAMRRGCRSS
jgi:hypothetical protein